MLGAGLSKRINKRSREMSFVVSESEDEIQIRAPRNLDEVRPFILAIDRKLTESDIMGPALVDAAWTFLKWANRPGAQPFDFLRDIYGKSKYNQYSLSRRQIAGVLNCYRAELLREFERKQ